MAMPASAVGAASVPVDIVVYHKASSVPPTGSFVGPGGAPAPVDLVTGSDLAAGRSFLRVATDRWEIATPSPNLCQPIAQ